LQRLQSKNSTTKNSQIQDHRLKDLLKNQEKKIGTVSSKKIDSEYEKKLKEVGEVV